MLTASFINFENPALIFFLIFFLIIALIIAHRYELKSVNSNKAFSIILIISSLTIGFGLHFRIDKRHNPLHYSHFIQTDKPNELLLTITKPLKSNTTYHKYFARVKSINGHKVSGKILLIIPVKYPKTEAGTQFRIMISAAQIQQPPATINPFTFNYRKYLALENVYHQINLKNSAWKIEHYPRNHWFSLFHSLRKKIKKYFSKFHSSEIQNLATALFLGERKELSPDIYKNFQAAGTIHILAISGLHIGILLIFLNYIFYPLKRINKFLFLLFTLGILWFYALLTGLSAPVVRAVVMFSFLQIGLQIKRKTNIYNSLFAAELVLLLFHPNFLFQTGFQMSFAAVLSIVSFQPVFSKRFRINNKFLQWWNDLFWVSVSAQLGVLPFTLYYFHQFPVYFFIANLLVIPLLFIILFSGFIAIIALVLSIDIAFLSELLQFLLQLLLSINREIASWKFSLIQHIYFPQILLAASLFLIYTFYIYLKNKRNFSRLILFLTAIILLQIAIISVKYSDRKENIFYVFHQFKTPVVALQKQGNLTIYQDKNAINPYLLQALQTRFSKISYNKLPVFQEFNQKKILHIDSLGIYNFNNYHPDMIILHNSPKINLDKVIHQLKPKLIVADGSNYPSYIRRWKHSAQQYGIYFVKTQDSAFVIRQ